MDKFTNNKGNFNKGNDNSGYWNSGNWNSGNRNSGNRNSGDWNSGNWNSGDFNLGVCNSGNYNKGDCNVGYYNNGSYNSGDFNKTNFSSGCFNTKEAKIMMFNKPTDLTFKDWKQSRAKILLDRIENYFLERIQAKNILEVDKNLNYYIEWWKDLSEEEKKVIKNMPNFDAGIFEEITGIKVD